MDKNLRLKLISAICGAVSAVVGSFLYSVFLSVAVMIKINIVEKSKPIEISTWLFLLLSIATIIPGMLGGLLIQYTIQKVNKGTHRGGIIGTVIGATIGITIYGVALILYFSRSDFITVITTMIFIIFIGSMLGFSSGKIIERNMA